MFASTRRAVMLAFLFTFLGGGLARASAPPAALQPCTSQTAGAIGGIVFQDLNGDGLRQASEPGVNGVVLNVTGPTGTTQAMTSGGVSDIPGQYSTGPTLCEAGDYVVTVVSVPPGYVVTGPSSRSVTLTRSPTGVLSKVGNLNFALGLAPCVSRIGDFVWNDLDADGIQDPGEPGLPGVVVHLYDGGTPVATTSTDANGYYTFVVPCTRTFRVEVETPAGFAPTTPLQGPDRALDSDGSPTTVTVGDNEHRTDIDFGFYALCRGRIGDFVWHDLNRNGVQDAGEPGIYNVRVELLVDGLVVRTAFTDASGYYEFDALCAETYEVRYDPATVPAGFVPTLTGQGTADTDSNPNSSSVTLPGFDSSDLTIDFGFQVPCSGILGDFVWEDLNANGIQDAGEPGLAGVQVRLYRDGESMPAQVTVTDANGYYQFTGLCGGSFTVEVNPATLPAGSLWVASPADAGGDDAVDSDGIDHRAGVTLPNDHASDQTIDFGYSRRLALTATKTAAGTFDRRITWTLTKTVAPTSHSGQAGQTAGASTWEVIAEKSEALGNYRVTGEISIHNPNGYAATFEVADVLNDGTAAAVSCPGDSIAAGGTVVCTYTASPTGGAATLNTATITSPVGGDTATAPVSFAATVIGDESVTLGDARFSYSQLISASSAPTFPETFVCPADASLYPEGSYSFTATNVATLTGDNTALEASVTVTVSCARQEQWAGETATGLGTVYPHTSNWFMYTPYTTNVVRLVAGRDHQHAGHIYMSRTGSGPSARTTLRIVLLDGWRWADVGEVLKVQPFDRVPTTYLEPGAFLYKFTAPNTAKAPNTTVLFSGTTVTVTMPGHSPRFYGIHGDVERLVR